MSARVLAGAALALAGGLAWLLWDPAQVSPREAGGSEAALRILRGEVAQLRSRLDGEATARAWMAEELERLAAVVERLEAVSAPLPPTARPERSAGAESAPAPSRDEASLALESTLVAAGFAPERVAELRERLDAIDLERLYLRDRAVREGWIGSERYRQERLQVEETYQSVRDEFGEELYDWLLYASGRPNRIVVQDVIQGSVAEESGLRPGDVVLRYADGWPRSPAELREATLAGRMGSLVDLEVRRSGERLRLLVPRGPLGVRLRSESVAPPPPS